MKLGMIVRGEDRGLGLQSWEAWRALQPDRTLLVDMGELAGGFAMHADRYPGASVVEYDHGLPQDVARRWMDGLDVVFSIETLYHPDLPAWAREMGVATAVQCNAEFMPPVEAIEHPATRYLPPTSWRLEHLPPNSRVLPVPVADDRFPFAVPERDGPLRVLHVAGHRAAQDRNGTRIVVDALPFLRGPMHVTIVSQDAKLMYRPRRSTATVEVVTGGVPDYWRLYDGYDVAVLPRRYGGLSLTAQEAMAAGLALVMTDAEPQRSTWPIVPVRTRASNGHLRCAAGVIPLHHARPQALADALNALAEDPEQLRAQQEASVLWAVTHRWSRWVDRYREELADVVALARA